MPGAVGLGALRHATHLEEIEVGEDLGAATKAGGNFFASGHSGACCQQRSQRSSQRTSSIPHLCPGGVRRTSVPPTTSTVQSVLTTSTIALGEIHAQEAVQCMRVHAWGSLGSRRSITASNC